MLFCVLISGIFTAPCLHGWWPLGSKKSLTKEQIIAKGGTPVVASATDNTVVGYTTKKESSEVLPSGLKISVGEHAFYDQYGKLLITIYVALGEDYRSIDNKYKGLNAEEFKLAGHFVETVLASYPGLVQSLKEDAKKKAKRDEESQKGWQKFGERMNAELSKSPEERFADFFEKPGNFGSGEALEGEEFLQAAGRLHNDLLLLSRII
jgi:hypothetical protein